MSSSEDSTTQEASVSGSDAATAAPNASASTDISLIPDLIDVADPTDMRSVTALIRDEVNAVLKGRDPENEEEVHKARMVMARIKPFLVPGNKAGTANTAHSEIGRIVISKSKVLQSMQNSGQLTYVGAWRQILVVLKKSEYMFSGGYFIANARDEAIADAADAA